MKKIKPTIRLLSSIVIAAMLFVNPNTANAVFGEEQAVPNASASSVYYYEYGDFDCYTAALPEMSFAELEKPETADLVCDAGESDSAGGGTKKHLDFSIEWNEDEYKAGLASGDEAFWIGGKYIKPVGENATEQVLEDFKNGLITVDITRSELKLQVRVVRSKTMPIEVALSPHNDGTYYPIFTFFNTVAEDEIKFEFSTDKVNWHYIIIQSVGLVSFISEKHTYLMRRDENKVAINVPTNKPSYFKMTVKGYAYDGVIGECTVSPDSILLPPPLPDSGYDDIDGNRGGGTQGEESRNPSAGEKAEISQNTPNGTSAIVEAGVENIKNPVLDVNKLAAGSPETADFIKASSGFAIAKMFSINMFDLNLKVTEVVGGKVEITLPFDGNSGLEYVMLRYNDDKTITVIPTAFADGKITFRTNHFSSYAIAVKSDNPKLFLDIDTASDTAKPENPTNVPLTGALLLGRLI